MIRSAAPLSRRPPYLLLPAAPPFLPLPGTAPSLSPAPPGSPPHLGNGVHVLQSDGVLSGRHLRGEVEERGMTSSVTSRAGRGHSFPALQPSLLGQLIPHATGLRFHSPPPHTHLHIMVCLLSLPSSPPAHHGVPPVPPLLPTCTSWCASCPSFRPIRLRRAG